ncbi:DUF1285 domain-containing protein [Glaciecola sp. XM2]|uniref:DUF1285 domain-containing protein n=1 Tax=Glaciecola sp. XM2 TaxID=1914931 RepID=UPI001BDE355D|nr:DUF1285 domain-containing protein [Glaciecola sp. XM2]MBT1451500.1 DUF1285 domain-containing protein [Glaciecola sp. XM2]
MDISALQSQLSEAGADKTPPVDKWDPPFCGDMNLVIKRSGQWWHEGTPFTRAALIKLFASVIKKEQEDYFLVTPVEKIGIQVEDVPFVVIDDSVVDEGIYVTTQCGDKVLISEAHPIELRKFEGSLVPYCLIRRNLWARIHQNVLYRWADRASPVKSGDKHKLLLSSKEYTFSIGEY